MRRAYGAWMSSITFADPTDALFFHQGQPIAQARSTGPSVVVTLVDMASGVIECRDVPWTPFEQSRHYRGKHWVGRRYEFPATQRRRMLREQALTRWTSNVYYGMDKLRKART